MKKLVLFVLLTLNSIMGFSMMEKTAVTINPTESTATAGEHYYRTLTSEDGTTTLMGLNDDGTVAYANQPTLDNLIKTAFGISDSDLPAYKDDLVKYLLTGSSSLGLDWPITCRSINCSIHGPGCVTCFWSGF